MQNQPSIDAKEKNYETLQKSTRPANLISIGIAYVLMLLIAFRFLFRVGAYFTEDKIPTALITESMQQRMRGIAIGYTIAFTILWLGAGYYLRKTKTDTGARIYVYREKDRGHFSYLRKVSILIVVCMILEFATYF